METAKGKTGAESLTELATRIDRFEYYDRPHATWMVDVAVRLARRLGLARADINAVKEAAMLHDIGLLAMAPPYHGQPRPLTLEERMDLWRHPIIGEQQAARRNALRHAQLLIRWHHEWWNGSGYPDMLAFEDIPIGARILRAVELYSALTSPRLYREALTEEAALDELRAAAGIECDPYVVQALIDLLEEMRRETQPEPASPWTPQYDGGTSDAAPVVPDAAVASENPAALANQPENPPQNQPVTEASESPVAPENPQNPPENSPMNLPAAEAPRWYEWRASRENRKTLLAFEASVLRQLEFRSVAIPYSGWSHLGRYLNAWNRAVLANDPRAWAAQAARAVYASREPLGEDGIAALLADLYVPGVRLSNGDLLRWFSEPDAWWMDNLRRGIERIEDPGQRAQAAVLGLQTGDYALSFDERTRDLRQPLATVFWRLAGRNYTGHAPHPQDRAYHMPVDEFISKARADLLYLNLPASHASAEGPEARGDWRESWMRGGGADLPATPPPQSRHAYLEQIDGWLRTASQFRMWAISYHETGLAAAADIVDLIKERRPVRATYTKDTSEVAGGLRHFIIVAEKA